MPTIKVVGRKRELQVQTEWKTTVNDFKKQVSQGTHIHEDRLRLTIGEGKTQIVLAGNHQLGAYAELKAGASVNYRDLGPQIGWRTVFIIEYLGPLLIYPLFLVPAIRDFVYGPKMNGWPVSQVQMYALAAWSFHYLKREVETIFVHKFSKGTMPLFNLWKNSFYYWGCAAAVSYFVNHPSYTAPALERSQLALVAFVVFELLNAVTHWQLSNLRKPGMETEHVLPRGLWWDAITCPNYTFEILSWVAFSVMTQTVTAYLFTLMGFVQMLEWARGKYLRYVKLFPAEAGKAPHEVFNKRKALIFPPFL